jgi:hypothetical protein
MRTGGEPALNDRPTSAIPAFRELFPVAALALVLMALLAIRTEYLTYDHPDFWVPSDHHKYIYLATHHPFSLHIPPFGWRLLAPTLARLLPFDLPTSFFMVTFLAMWMTSVAAYVLARVYGFSRTLSIVGMLMFLSLVWATKFNLFEFWRTDATAFFFVMLAIILVASRHDGAFCLILAIGVLAKESVVFVAPLRYSLMAEKPFDAPLAMRSLLLALPAIAVLIALRVGIPPMNQDPGYVATLPPALYGVGVIGDNRTYELLPRLAWVVAYRIRTFNLALLYAYTLGPWGIMVGLLPLAGGRTALRLAVRFLPFLALAYVQLLFAPVNTLRLLVIAFPAVVLLALTGVRRIMERFRTPPGRFVLLAAAFYGTLLLSLPVPRLRVSLFQQAVIFLVLLPLLLGWDRRIARRFSRSAAGKRLDTS